MKKFYVYLLLLTLAACSESKSLGGAYYVSRSDSSHVYIWKKTVGKPQVVVDEQVVDWKRVKDHLMVLRKIAQSPDCYDKSGVATIITHYSNDDEFWIFDLESSSEYGPYTADQYKLRLSALGLPFVMLRTPKNYFVNTDYFMEYIKTCEKLVF